tara:strand:- start:163 stop:393 length:231 start_codon:yes stop_codon:yes gene_type:complete
MKKKLKEMWIWIVSLFTTRYRLTVSYNNTWGDSDDQEFIVKKFFWKQEKYISFLDENNETVEIRGASGLNYRIQRL